jgi:polyphosphate kinase 2 (PPK2 family)
MKLDSKKFRVRPAANVDLRNWPTEVKPVYESKEQYRKLLEEHVGALSSLQQLHYASNRYARLLIFQAMDAAGKDGAIRHVTLCPRTTTRMPGCWSPGSCSMRSPHSRRNFRERPRGAGAN